MKFVETLNFNEAACVLALKEKELSCLVIANADANAPDGLDYSEGDQPALEKGSFTQAFHVMAKQCDVVLETEGKFYRAGEWTNRPRLGWGQSRISTWNSRSLRRRRMTRRNTRSSQGRRSFASGQVIGANALRGTLSWIVNRRSCSDKSCGSDPRMANDEPTSFGFVSAFSQQQYIPNQPHQTCKTTVPPPPVNPNVPPFAIEKFVLHCAARL